MVKAEVDATHVSIDPAGDRAAFASVNVSSDGDSDRMSKGTASVLVARIERRARVEYDMMEGMMDYSFDAGGLL